MSRNRLLGGRPPSAVALVEPSASRWYARRARVALFAVAFPAGALTAAVLSMVAHPAVAVVLGAIIGAGCGLAAAIVVRAWPVLRVVWHWAGEIAVSAAVLVPVAVLASATHPLVAAVAVVAVGSAAGLVRPVRRRLAAWVWCVVVRHRLRVCFAEFIRSAARARPGSLPLILWARPTPAGERVWVWLRPGLDLADLDGRTGKVAVACWAAAVRVVRASTRYAALVRVDISRRDPLTGMVASPLARLIPSPEPVVPVSPGLPPLGLDLPDVPEEVPDARVSARR